MPYSPLTTQGTFREAARKRQISELIDIMSPREVPLLKLVGINGEPGHNPKFEWMEDTLLAESAAMTTGTTDIIGSSSDTYLYFAAADLINFQKGMVVKVNDELLYISSDADTVNNKFTVVRGVGGSSASASHADTDVVEIVGLANFEGSDTPLKATTEFTIPYNYFQAFDQSYKISYIAANTDVYGVPQGDDARELEKAFEEITIKLERTCYLGQRADYDSSNVVPRLMGGFAQYLTTAGTSNYATNLSSAQLTEKAINDMLQDRYYKVGAQNMGMTLICGAWNKRRINDLYAPYARMTRNERTGGVLVDTIDTDWGPVDVVMSLRCPKSKVYLVNLDYISVHPYEGLAFFDEEKASSGAYTIRQIYGVYSMSIRNPKCMGLIYGTATS